MTSQPSSSKGLGVDRDRDYDRLSYDGRRSGELFTTAEVSPRPAGKMIFTGAVGTGSGGPGAGLAPSKSAGRRPQIQGPQPQPLQPEIPPESPLSPTTPRPRYSRMSMMSSGTMMMQNRTSVVSPGTTPTRENFNFLQHDPMEFDQFPGTPSRVTSAGSRSIYIGFDPAASSASTPSSGSSSNPVIPNFPPPPIPSNTTARRGSNSSVSTYQSGPPPSRRGVSSYYQYLVQPIPEESSTPEYRHGSFASSHVIPSSWGSGPQGFWIPATNEELMSDVSSISERSGRSGSRSSRSPRSDINFEDFDEGTTLVRQASVGKKTKARMTDIKRSDSTRDSTPRESRASVTSLRPPMPPMLQVMNPSAPTESSASPSTERLSVPEFIPMPPIPVAVTTGEPSPVERPSLWKRFSRANNRNSMRQAAGTSSAAANRMSRIIDEEKDLAVPLRRPIPPRLNMEAVREAESRGSLTSLPDLIRRATKLAAVLETGRPGSRWGSASLAPSAPFTDSSSMLHESMADMLASFPPPVLAHGSRRNTNRVSAWPLPQDLQYQSSRGQSSKKQQRRICGLPLWAFILLVLIALAVITAAVVVPLQLVALSKASKQDTAASSNTGPSVQQCQKSQPCQNEGISVIQGTTCGCVCTNGFTGANCTERADAACTSLPMVGSDRNLTIGSAIPRLLSVARPNFNILLNATTLVTTFAANNNSCTFQNSLVTFEGESTRASPDSAAPTPTSSDSSSPSKATDGTFVLNENVLDFSRVAVLFLVQEDGVNIGQQAQRVLQGRFDQGADFNVLTVDETLGAKVDLDNLSVSAGKGKPSVGGPSTKKKK